MHWDSALGASIEVAIAIAEFAGIVAAVGRRNPGGWTAGDQIRLRILLTASAVAGLFAFLPFVLFEAGLAPTLAWRVGSGAQAAWLVGIMGYRARQSSLAGASTTLPLARIVLLGAVIVVGLLFNAAYLAQSWIYIVGVIFQLGVGFWAFVGLLLGSWRDRSDAALGEARSVESPSE